MNIISFAAIDNNFEQIPSKPSSLKLTDEDKIHGKTIDKKSASNANIKESRIINLFNEKVRNSKKVSVFKVNEKSVKSNSKNPKPNRKSLIKKISFFLKSTCKFLGMIRLHSKNSIIKKFKDRFSTKFLSGKNREGKPKNFLIIIYLVKKFIQRIKTFTFLKKIFKLNEYHFNILGDKANFYINGSQFGENFFKSLSNRNDFDNNYVHEYIY